jgi:hypothetical protein
MGPGLALGLEAGVLPTQSSVDAKYVDALVQHQAFAGSSTNRLHPSNSHVLTPLERNRHVAGMPFPWVLPGKQVRHIAACRLAWLSAHVDVRASALRGYARDPEVPVTERPELAGLRPQEAQSAPRLGRE